MILNTSIRSFLHAARHLSFSVAARKTYISQPAVSARIKRLEEYFNVELFERTPAGLRLTAAGKTFFDYAQRLEQMVAEAERAVKDISEGDDVHLYLGANRSATSFMLPDLLIHFSQTCPDVRIRTELQSPEQLLERLSYGFLDAVIVEQAVDEERFHVIPLLRDEVVVICQPDHPLASRGKISIDELCAVPLVTNSPNSGTRQMLRERLDLYEKHDSDLNIIMELQNIELVKQMTVRRSALGLVSRLVMSQQKNQDHLVMLQINDEPMCRVFSLVTTHKSLERPNVRRLCDIASEIYDTEMLFPRAAEAAV
ncbi:MAG TPA: LysR family transcriptional regulator [Gammaproteobacteria bacterium]